VIFFVDCIALTRPRRMRSVPPAITNSSSSDHAARRRYRRWRQL
jgi:hypothetical protein